MIVLVSEDGDLQKERLSKRALGEGEVSKETKKESDETMQRQTGGAEEVDDTEPNTFEVKVTKAMSLCDTEYVCFK